MTATCLSLPIFSVSPCLPWWVLFSLPRRRNRLFERRGHVGVRGHHMRGLRHVRLATEPGAYRVAISHREPAFTTHRHPFTSPAMRRGDWDAEIACDGCPAFEEAFSGR